MEINEELLACYIEGTATAEERAQMRQYLCKHPEECMHILCVMDTDIEDYLNEYTDDTFDVIPLESSFTDIACSAAAFAPQQNRIFKPKGKPRFSKIEGLNNRLKALNGELNEL